MSKSPSLSPTLSHRSDDGMLTGHSRWKKITLVVVLVMMFAALFPELGTSTAPTPVAASKPVVHEAPHPGGKASFNQVVGTSDKARFGAKQHVVVTGGAGYIGSHAVKQLLKEGYYVTVIDNFSRGNMGAVEVLKRLAAGTMKAGERAKRAPKATGSVPFRFVHGDLGDRTVVRAALENGPKKPDLVIHFAAVAYVGESVANPLQYYRNISTNSQVLLEEMHAAGVMNLVFSSTCATYGNPKELPVTEKTPTIPMYVLPPLASPLPHSPHHRSPYGSAKLWVENVIRDYAVANKGFKVGILRYFNVYGCDPDGYLGEWPRPLLQKQHGRVTNACLDAAAGTIPKMGILGTTHPTPDGTCIRDFIHVADLVDAHIAVASKLANPPVLYNVGTGAGVSVRELLTKCRAATGVNFTITEQAEPRPGDSPQIYADNTKIRTETNWAPKFSDVQVGLGHCWKWRQSYKHSGYGDLAGEGTE